MSRCRIMAALAALTAGACLAGLSAAEDRKDSDRKGGGDREFVTKASASGLAEVNLSNLAARRASTPEVRSFAQRIIADHTRANRELLGLANDKGWSLARAMDDQHQKLFDKLGKMDGADFDRAYMDGMVKDHEDAVKLFDQESKDGSDDTLKTWAGRTLPALKMHLKMAQEIAKGGGKDSKEGRDR